MARWRKVPFRRGDRVGINLRSVNFSDSRLDRENGKNSAAAVKFDKQLRLQLACDPDEFRGQSRHHRRVDLKEGKTRHMKISIGRNRIQKKTVRLLPFQQKGAVMRSKTERQGGAALRQRVAKFTRRKSLSHQTGYFRTRQQTVPQIQNSPVVIHQVSGFHHRTFFIRRQFDLVSPAGPLCRSCRSKNLSLRHDSGVQKKALELPLLPLQLHGIIHLCISAPGTAPVRGKGTYRNDPFRGRLHNHTRRHLSYRVRTPFRFPHNGNRQDRKECGRNTNVDASVPDSWNNLHSRNDY